MSSSTPAIDRVNGSAQTPDGPVDGWETDFPRLPPESSPDANIPDALDQMAPGPVLGAYLATVDIDSLCGYDRVVVLRAHQRMVSYYQARAYEDMVAVREALEDSDRVAMYTSMAAAAEIRAALNLTRRSADIELSFALELTQRLPKLLEMLAGGLIDLRRAKAIERGTCHLSAAAARDVVDRVAESAPHMTTGQIAARVRKLCIESYPDQAKERFERAISTRRLVMEPTVDGTANLLGLEL
ncbi:MAG: DUF222 domain-containing protein, partial [Actinomycetota bacterium]